jgi:8-oxo-dGTP pyrophosphatase MutT (NUDIX family)
MDSPSFLPLQVAAVCYRRRGASFDFLLVKTTSGDKWTFPKGATARRLSHSQAAEREALEEAGAVGVIEPQHFHLYLQPKSDSRLRDGVQEFVVKAFMLEVTRTHRPQEPNRSPTWFSADDARSALARGREERHAAEVCTVIDRAVEHLSTEGRIRPRYRPALTYRIWRSLVTLLEVVGDFVGVKASKGRRVQ